MGYIGDTISRLEICQSGIRPKGKRYGTSSVTMTVLDWTSLDGPRKRDTVISATVRDYGAPDWSGAAAPTSYWMASATYIAIRDRATACHRAPICAIRWSNRPARSADLLNRIKLISTCPVPPRKNISVHF